MLLKHVQHLKTLAVKRQRVIQSRKTAVPDLSELGHHVFIESWIFCFCSIICSSHDSTQQPHLISLCVLGAIIFFCCLNQCLLFCFFFPSISYNIAKLSSLTQSLGAWVFPFCMVEPSCLPVVILWLGWEKTKLIFMQIPTVYQTSQLSSRSLEAYCVK